MSSKQHRPSTARLGSSAKARTKSKDKIKEPKTQKWEKKKSPLSDLLRNEVIEAKRRQNILEEFFLSKKQYKLTPSTTNKLNKFSLSRNKSSTDKDKFLKSVLLTREKLLKSRKMATEANIKNVQDKAQRPPKIENKEQQLLKTKWIKSREKRLKDLRMNKSRFCESSPEERLQKFRWENNRSNECSREERLRKQGKTIEDRLKKCTPREKQITKKQSKPNISSSEDPVGSKFEVRIEKVNKTVNTESLEESGETFLKEIDLRTCSKCEKDAIPENVSTSCLQVKRMTSSMVFLAGIRKLSGAILKELQGNANKKIKIIAVDGDEDEGKKLVQIFNGNNGSGIMKEENDAMSTNTRVLSQKCVDGNKTLMKEEMMKKMQDTSFVTFNDVNSETKEKECGENSKDECSQIQEDSCNDVKNVHSNGLSNEMSCGSEEKETEEENMLSSMKGTQENSIMEKNPLAYYISLNNDEEIRKTGKEIDRAQAIQDEIKKIQSYVEKTMNARKPQRTQMDGDGTLSKYLNCLEIINNFKTKFPVQHEPTPIGDQSLEQGDAIKTEEVQVKPVVNQRLKKNDKHNAKQSNRKQKSENNLNPIPSNLNQADPPIPPISKQSKLSKNSEETNKKTADPAQTPKVPLISTQTKLSKNLEKNNAGNATSISKQSNFEETNTENAGADAVSLRTRSIQTLDKNYSENEISISTSQKLEKSKSENLNVDPAVEVLSTCNQASCIQDVDLNQTDEVSTMSQSSFEETNSRNGVVDSASFNQTRSMEEKVHPIVLIALKLSKISERLEMLLQDSNFTRFTR